MNKIELCIAPGLYARLRDSKEYYQIASQIAEYYWELNPNPLHPKLAL